MNKQVDGTDHNMNIITRQTMGRLYSYSVSAAAYRLSGSKAYLDHSKVYLRDMMKASKLRGRAGQLGLALAATLLIMTLLEAAWGLMGKSSSKHQQAEQLLLEARQVHIWHLLQGCDHHQF